MRVATRRRTPATAALRSVQNGASTLLGRAAVRKVLVDELDVGAGAAAHHQVPVADHPDAAVGLARVLEGRHVEVGDRLVTDSRERRDSEEAQGQIAPDGEVPGATWTLGGSAPASVPSKVRRSNGRLRAPVTVWRLSWLGSRSFRLTVAVSKVVLVRLRVQVVDCLRASDAGAQAWVNPTPRLLDDSG